MLVMMINTIPVWASSHREAPLISNDPLADNTDLYAFRSPDDQNKITIVANYIPGQLPQGGPNYYSFGENIRYEIHIDNNAANNTYFNGDDIVYRFTFKKKNEDPSTFFNIRLGQQNLKTTYMLERSMDGGLTFQTIVNNGIVPPPNIGPRSISGAAGLNTPNYNNLITQAVATTNTGEKVFCGTADDPLSGGAVTRIEVKDIKPIFEEFKQRGTVKEKDLRENTPWGTNEFAFHDLNSNAIFISEDI